MRQYNFEEINPQLGYFICRSCVPGWEISNSVIDFIDLTYIYKGKARYTVNGATFEAESGDLVCIPKNSQRYGSFVAQYPMWCFAANFQLYDLKGSEMQLPFPVQSRIGIHEDLLSLYRELNRAWMKKNPGYVIEARAIFLNILYRCFSMLYYKDSPETIDPRIKKAIRYICDNYSAKLEASELAAMFGLNPSYFGTLFKKATGHTVKGYINQVRINQAENLLASGEFSVMQVSQRCGFEDMFYFSNVFKSLKGYPPSKVALHQYFR